MAAKRKRRPKNPKRNHLRLKMRGSLHGGPIAVPEGMSPRKAADIFRRTIQLDTPVDEGTAVRKWRLRELVNGDFRIENRVVYIRKLMIDGHSKQAPPGVYNQSIKKACKKIRAKSSG